MKLLVAHLQIVGCMQLAEKPSMVFSNLITGVLATQMVITTLWTPTAHVH